MKLLPLAAFVMTGLLGACAQPAGPGPSAPPGVQPSSITVTSKAFTAGGAIPVDYTCDGKDVSPPLTLSSPPAGTKAIVLIVDDPDAPGGTFTHWILFNVPPETVTLAEAVDAASLGAKAGQNDFHAEGYRGPCPPKGDGMHVYRFTVYAADAPLTIQENAMRADVDAALSNHVLGYGRLSGLFGH